MKKIPVEPLTYHGQIQLDARFRLNHSILSLLHLCLVQSKNTTRVNAARYYDKSARLYVRQDRHTLVLYRNECTQAPRRS